MKKIHLMNTKVTNNYLFTDDIVKDTSEHNVPIILNIKT